ncbi:MAG: hypothetical protein KC621_12155 [Myxococcales bacterium]|nr:hypothetical protein [Myxococcales bacterium]
MIRKCFLPAVCLLGLFASNRAQATRVPIVDETCDLGDLDPRGMTVEPGGFAVAGFDTDPLFLAVVRRIDASCNLVDEFSLGSANPTGIAYDPTSGGYVVASDSLDELRFYTTAGVPTGTCDLGAAGVASPQGVAYDTVTGLFAVVDIALDQVLMVDDSVTNGNRCNIVSTVDLIPSGATTAFDITYVPAMDAFGVLDSARIVLVDRAGVYMDEFDLRGPGVFTSRAVVYDPTTDRYRIGGSPGTGQRMFTLDARGTTELLCDTTAWGIGSPQAVTVHPATGELVVVDATNHPITIVDPGTCNVVRQMSMVSGVSGLAYLPGTNELAMTFQASHELVFVDYDTGAEQRRCNLADQGLLNPTGVTSLPDLDRLAITTTSGSSGGDWAIVDTDCNVVHARNARSLAQAAATSVVRPVDIAHVPGLGAFLVVDDAQDEVYLATLEGTLDRRFDLGGAGFAGPMGIATTGTPGELFVTEATVTSHALHRLTIPALAEAHALSGRFESPSTTLYLWERGEGRVTGTAILAGNSLPVFGEFVGGVGGLTIGAVTPGGAPVTFSITVSGDLNTISAPPPVGTLNRVH